MITEFEKKYTSKQKILAEINDNVEDDFYDIHSKLELFTSLKLENNELEYGLYLTIRDIQDYLKGIEYKILKNSY